MKKTLSIVAEYAFYAILIIFILILVTFIIMKKDSDDAANIFGYQLRVVQSSSMEQHESVDTTNFEIKDIKVKSSLFVKTAPSDDYEKNEWYKTLKAGDVITFKYLYTKQETITHRIIDITPKEDGFLITLEGDNKSSDTSTLTQVIDTTLVDSPNYIIGKVVGQSYVLGLLIFTLREPIGMFLVIIIPCLIVIGFQIIRIINVLSKDKKSKENTKLLLQEEALQKQKEALEKQAKELEELKRMINKET